MPAGQENAMAEDEDWHLDKKVPISIIIALVLQTFGFVAIGSAWKAEVESRLAVVEKQVDERKNQGDRLIVLEEQLRFIKESLTRIEVRLGEGGAQ